MSNLLLDKKHRDAVFSRIESLQHEVNVYKDDAEYYKELLMITRKKLLRIHSLAGAKSVIADKETTDQAWMRSINEIIEAL